MNINCHNMLDSIAIGQRAAVARPDGLAASEKAKEASAEAGAARQERFRGPFNNKHLEELKSQWGQSGSPYDLDGNGTVDTDDLMLMLSNWEQAEPPPPPPPPPGGPYNQSTIDLIHSEWGKTDSPADINGDGIVNTDDILAAFSNWEQPGDTGETPPPGGPYDQSTLDQITSNWGQSGSAGDINGDGNVDTDDILFALSNWATPAAAGSNSAATTSQPQSAAAEIAPVASDRPTVDQSSLSQRQIRRLSASLIQRLEAGGFEHRPPVNLREIVGRLNLGSADRQSVMALLHERFPDGIGVNLKA